MFGYRPSWHAASRVPFLKKRSRELAARLPFGRFVDLRGVAHLPQMENPDLVATMVLQALP